MKSVAILLAIYKPNKEFFIKQLNSLAQQTYSNCEIYIYDDSGDSISNSENEKVISQILNNVKYQLFINEKNMGSNKTFENLTHIAEADYFAYCDQDDIWEQNKIEKLVKLLEKDEESVLAYSDLRLINEKDETIAESFKESHPRLVHKYGIGKHLTEFYIRRNSVTGCSMLINSTIAKKSIPFPNTYVHDHWLALNATLNGNIMYTPEKLVQYRIHGSNQIGNSIFPGIDDKNKYLERIQNELRKIETVKEVLVSYENFDVQIIHDYEFFVENRERMFVNGFFSKTLSFLKVFKKDKVLTTFEFILSLMPNFISKFIFKVLKR